MTNESGQQRRGRSRGLNKVQIIGNLGRDPEMRFTQDGTPVTNFSVAVNDSWQGRDGEARERTEWFRIVAWRRLAEIANEYLRRGSQVYIEGRLETRQWQDREGNDRTTTELIARDMMMLGSRSSGGDGGGSYGDRDEARSDGGGRPDNQSGNRPAADQGDISPDDLPF